MTSLAKDYPELAAPQVVFLCGAWRVVWNGDMCSPSWQSKGGALAYLAMLQKGQREPEISYSAKS